MLIMQMLLVVRITNLMLMLSTAVRRVMIIRITAAVVCDRADLDSACLILLRHARFPAASFGAVQLVHRFRQCSS